MIRFTLYVVCAAISGVTALVHPGLLHTNADFDRIRGFVEAGVEPQLTGWKKLAARANPDYKPQATSIICRGASWCNPHNFHLLYRDAHAAYANAIYWKVTGDKQHADAAAAILDSWSSTLTAIMGSSDRYLVSGLQGYQLANAAEVLRDYPGWKGLQATVKMLQRIFLPMNVDFLETHLGAAIDHYWANWGLANLCSLHAIGVVADNQTAVDQATSIFLTGKGNEALEKTIWRVHKENGSGKPLGQGQEAGRDQGHSILDFALLGVLAQQSYNQGNDLFASLENRILAGAEYVFKYNMEEDVPYSTYTWSEGSMTKISPSGRGNIRPVAELIYAHYNGVKRLNASWTGAYRDMVVKAGGGAEGGGGDYGGASGGYDQLGFGTALFRLKE